MSRAGRGACRHPLDDEVIQTFSMVRRDLVEGREWRLVGYFCQRHRRFGTWESSSPIPPMALAPLQAAIEAEGRS